jgi:hypothetical protein
MSKDIKFLHYSKEKIEEIKTPKKLGISFKPKNCLWLSCNEDWEEIFDEFNNNLKKNKKYNHIYDVDIDLSKMIILDSKKDIINFTKKFQYKYIVNKTIKNRKTKTKKVKKENYILIDWDKVREETGSYGIFIKNASYSDLQMKYLWYSTIDICSVAIWDKRGILSLKEKI